MVMLHPLDRKLLRDLLRLRGQAVAIALIIASGVGVQVMSLIAIASLDESARAYYDRYQFADVFAGAERVPAHVAAQIAEIPGVRAVEPRIVKLATLDLPGFDEPVVGSLVSLPEGRQPDLNRIALRRGRYLERGSQDEAIVSEPFAEAHRLAPGDHIRALINGRKRRLHIVGVALSPEFVYAIGPGALMPDDKRYGVLWMGEAGLAAAYDLTDAFNDVALALSRGASAPRVIEAVDALLEPYGSVGAVARAEQISNWFLSNEIAQLESLANLMPAIFFAVGAFLANMVLARLIMLDRGEIGLLKAFGYSDLAVAWHYLKLAIVIAAAAILAGWVLGLWLGRWSTELYAGIYRFPTMYFALSARTFALSGALSLAVALIGAAGAVRRAARLPPAEAMRPPAPPVFHARLGMGGWSRRLDQPTRIISRNLLRSPVRSGLTALGSGTAVAVLVMSLQWIDSIDYLVEDYFEVQQRQDVMLGLTEAKNERVVRAVERLPGVLEAEPQRTVLARLRHGHLTKRQSIRGVEPDSELQVIRDAAGDRVEIPPTGLVLSSKLAELLEVGVGDPVTVEVLESRRPVAPIRVSGVFETFIGTPAYVSRDALNRLLGEPSSANVLMVKTDSRFEPELFAKLKDTPAAAAVVLTRAAIETFHRTMGDTVLVFISFYVAFACTLAFGVVYNAMRVALSERGRELATLGVIGLSTNEIFYTLLGESAALVLVSLPAGCGLGWLLARLMAAVFDTELYRVPLVIEPATYGLSVIIALAAALGSAALIRDRVERLDLIAVLKTRE